MFRGGRPFARRRALKSLLSLLAVGFLLTLIYFLGIWREGDGSENIVPDDVMVMLRQSPSQREYIDKKGIHVIVGQYNGKSFPWSDGPNLTEEILNSNFYSPDPSYGQLGLPVYLNQAELPHAKTLFQINKFNLLVSDRIPLNRTLTDPRKKICQSKRYAIEEMKNTSVIIVFHNEAFSTLARTVTSVINRSPHQLLHEVILVSDASDRKFLADPLDRHMSSLTNETGVPIHILRSPQRVGLVAARMMGSRLATGQVLTFLDAHCEAAPGWLEPLLDRVTANETNVVCPVIDIINAETFAYSRSFELHWGAFNWAMHFRWFPITARALSSDDRTSPFMSPAMAGGLFSMDREYFFKMGGYDENMDIWGGENLEMSFRVWQCGGRIEIAPCSHVGHLFRKSSPYTFPRKGGVTGVLYTNLARVVSVWMDDWRDFYRLIEPAAGKFLDKPEELTGIDDRKKLRKDLKCKSFKWYLENVWTEHFFPSEDRFFGQVRNRQLGLCLQRGGGKVAGSSAGRIELEKCAIETYSPQSFVYTKEGFLMSDESVCLDVGYGTKVPNSGRELLLLACSRLKRQKFIYTASLESLKHVESGLCASTKRSPSRVILEECHPRSQSQKWQLISHDWSHKP